MKDENYINIAGWMINQLDLKGNQLIIYAIIYGFSQDETSNFTGSLQYLADWTNSTKQGVLKALKELLEKDLIIKEEKIKNGIKLCSYKHNETKLNSIKQSLMGIKQSLMGGIKQSLTPIKQSLMNNIEYNIDNNNININNNVQFNKFYSLYPKKQSKQSAIKAFNKVIKTTKLETILAGLDKYKKHIENLKLQPRYIKLPATWLNGGCWEDEYEQSENSDKNELLDIVIKELESDNE